MPQAKSRRFGAGAPPPVGARAGVQDRIRGREASSSSHFCKVSETGGKRCKEKRCVQSSGERTFCLSCSGGTGDVSWGGAVAWMFSNAADKCLEQMDFCHYLARPRKTMLPQPQPKTPFLCWGLNKKVNCGFRALGWSYLVPPGQGLLPGRAWGDHGRHACLLPLHHTTLLTS